MVRCDGERRRQKYGYRKSDIEEITAKSLLMQTNAAKAQHRSLCRGTHASGVCVRGQFEIFDVTAKRPPELTKRLAKGIFAKRGLRLELATGQDALSLNDTAVREGANELRAAISPANRCR